MAATKKKQVILSVNNQEFFVEELVAIDAKSAPGILKVVLRHRANPVQTSNEVEIARVLSWWNENTQLFQPKAEFQGETPDESNDSTE